MISFNKKKLNNNDIIIILNSFLIIVFIYFFINYIYLSYNVIYLNIQPYFSDEYAYFLNVKSFLLTNSLGSSITLNEEYSKIGDFSFHGPMYTLFYGLLCKIFEINNILYINILFSILFVGFVFLIRIELYKKLLICIVYLSFFTVILYSFTYMTEAFHLFFSGIVSFLIYKIYNNCEEQGKFNYIYLILFICIIFVLSTFRQSWIFFIFALFPFFVVKNKFFIILLILSFGLIFVIVDMFLFHASYPLGFIHNLMQDFDFNSLVENFTTNFNKYFISEKYSNLKFIFKYLFVLIFIICFYYGIIKKDKTLLSIFLVSLFSLFSLFSLYDAFSWKEVRSLSYLFISMIFLLVLREKYLMVFIIIILQAFSYSKVVNYHNSIVNDRINMNQIEVSYLEEDLHYILKVLSSESNYNNNDSLKTILIKDNFIPLGNSPAMLILPLKYNQDIRIRYSFIYGNFSLENSEISNYYLSNVLENSNRLELLYKNNSLYFYKIEK